MNSYLQATNSSIFILGSALAAAHESESSCTAQGWQQEGHCPSPSPAPLSWTPHPWGDQVNAPGSVGDQGLTMHFYDLLLPRPLLFYFWPPDFLTSHKKGCSYCCSHLFFFLLHKVEKHSMVPERRAATKKDWAWTCAQEPRYTHIGRSQRPWFPLPREYCCTKNRGRSSGLIFPPLLHLQGLFIHCIYTQLVINITTWNKVGFSTFYLTGIPPVFLHF